MRLARRVEPAPNGLMLLLLLLTIQTPLLPLLPPLPPIPIQDVVVPLPSVERSFPCCAPISDPISIPFHFRRDDLPELYTFPSLFFPPPPPVFYRFHTIPIQSISQGEESRLLLEEENEDFLPRIKLKWRDWTGNFLLQDFYWENGFLLEFMSFRKEILATRIDFHGNLCVFRFSPSHKTHRKGREFFQTVGCFSALFNHFSLLSHIFPFFTSTFWFLFTFSVENPWFFLSIFVLLLHKSW